MRYDRRAANGAGIHTCLADVRLESILVGISRSDVSVVVALIICLVV